MRADRSECSLPRDRIRKTVDKQRHRKMQSDGHGQFGDVWIRFEPYSVDEAKLAAEEE